ncbi:uncharacterized protein E6C27_scaffold773G00040 [Cucumis melo var. makuwa]|uniref:Uncharacterized protein n=1 Tax=Cucumis melo var. makuwa TaxID=1194695 RepID=A0A5A7UA66_CUCMM|nr:uncharacterized protein E6C27_scaffold773G00040 [Cucumis melo var. makuwa]
MKKSIFFELPYWLRLSLRLKLDGRRIEKNVYDNLVGTLLNIEGKTKDTTNARLNLQDLKIRKDLHLVDVGNRLVKPYASYTLTSNKRVEICKFLKSVKFFNGFVSNISRCAHEREGKVSGLKTHNCHVLLHRLLPIDDPRNGSNWKVVQVFQNKRILDVPQVEDVENKHINVLEIVVSHRVDNHIEDYTMCRIDIDPTIVERLVDIMSLMTSSAMWMNTCHMQATTMNYSDKPRIMSSSYQRNNFLEMDIMFLKFEDDLDNLAGGSSSVGNNTGSSSQPPMTPTPSRRTQSQLLELERTLQSINIF